MEAIWKTSRFVGFTLLLLLGCAACSKSPAAPSGVEQSEALSASDTSTSLTPNENSTASGQTAHDVVSPNPLFVSPGAPQEATCTVEVKKTERFDKQKGKGAWVPYVGEILEIEPPEQILLKFELEVNIPAGHSVTPSVDKAVITSQGNEPFILTALNGRAKDSPFKPRNFSGPLAGKQTLEFQFDVPKEVTTAIPQGDKKKENQAPVVKNTFMVELGWGCHRGFDLVSQGKLGTLKFKGVDKGKK